MRFIRVHGRIVPIKEGSNSGSGKSKKLVGAGVAVGAVGLLHKKSARGAATASNLHGLCALSNAKKALKYKAAGEMGSFKVLKDAANRSAQGSLNAGGAALAHKYAAKAHGALAVGLLGAAAAVKINSMRKKK